MSSGGKGGKPKQPVTAYYASAHYGVCHGPVDEVLEVWYGEKRLWGGAATSNTTLNISKPSLFGGEKVEGGFVGRIALLLGGAAQKAPAALAVSLRRNGAATSADPDELPGYRNVFSFFVHGGG
ncbi:hypothetical protein [Billgrantia desiderata]|uniref:hypothetical protein n=1 Tax=Billgrantia desiderata TaxID=52021 RepID=UPI001F2F21C2|nr:hypothetical protein [Halomonas desiderata]MCE8012902.1 hypothetical protein [Halomonas desiderata]